MKILASLPDSAFAGSCITVIQQYPSSEPNADPFAERMLSTYLLYTPALWALGLLTPLGACLLLALVCRNACWKKFGLVVWAWWLVGVMQAVSVMVNWVDTDLPIGELLYKMVGAHVTGWFFIGAAIGVGKTYGLASPRVARAVCVLGLYLLAFGLVSMIIGMVSGMDRLDVPSPLALLFPGNLSFVKNSLTMRFFVSEETFNSTIPRLILFYPWSVCLGFAAIAVFMIALEEPEPSWRLIGLSGGLIGLIGSMSRASIVAFLVVGTVYGWQRIQKTYRWAGIALVSSACTLLLVMDAPVLDIILGTATSVTEVREGSSEARQLGYEESWSGFLQSPALGYGWPGDPLSETIPMFVGSHSTVYGVLYTGGLITFLPFCFAMLTTVFAVTLRALTGQQSLAAQSIAFTLMILCYGEGIYSFALPTLFACCWLGGGLSSIDNLTNVSQHAK